MQELPFLLRKTRNFGVTLPCLNIWEIESITKDGRIALSASLILRKIMEEKNVMRCPIWYHL